MSFFFDLIIDSSDLIRNDFYFYFFSSFGRSKNRNRICLHNDNNNAEWKCRIWRRLNCNNGISFSFFFVHHVPGNDHSFNVWILKICSEMITVTKKKRKEKNRIFHSKRTENKSNNKIQEENGIKTFLYVCVSVCACEKLATSIMMVDVCFWNRKNRIFEKNKIEKNVYQFNLYQECLKKCLSDCKWWVLSVWSNNRFQLNFFFFFIFGQITKTNQEKVEKSCNKKKQIKGKEIAVCQHINCWWFVSE